MALHPPMPDPGNQDYYPFENSDHTFCVYGRLLDLERSPCPWYSGREFRTLLRDYGHGHMHRWIGVAHGFCK